VGPRKYRYHSPIISAEWCAFTNFPWGRGLINFEAKEEKRAIETYETWLKLFQLLPYYSWIVDRFHLSTILYQKQHFGRDYNFDWLEENLKKLGFRLVLCTRNPDSFQDALRERLKVSGNPSQYKDLNVFINEQEDFRKLARASKIEMLELDISDNNIERASDQIADWLEETGGLYASY
jgi:thymidylate kinase